MSRAVATLLAAVLLAGCGSIPAPGVPVGPGIPVEPVGGLEGVSLGMTSRAVVEALGSPTTNPPENPGEPDLVIYLTAAGEWVLVYTDGVLTSKALAPTGVAK